MITSVLYSNRKIIRKLWKVIKNNHKTEKETSLLEQELAETTSRIKSPSFDIETI